MKFVFKNGYNIENLKKEEKIIYFDIDNTLSSTTGFESKNNNEQYWRDKKIELNIFLKENNIKSLDLLDFSTPEANCLGLFLRLLKETGAKAVCVSSWATSLRIRSGDNINPVDLLDNIFKNNYEYWEKGLIVGLKNFSGDRAEIARDITSELKLTNDYLLIDDSVGNGYPEDENTINVDGVVGFSYYNYLEALDKLNSN